MTPQNKAHQTSAQGACQTIANDPALKLDAIRERLKALRITVGGWGRHDGEALKAEVDEIIRLIG